jgi:hypothetical protein
MKIPASSIHALVYITRPALIQNLDANGATEQRNVTVTAWLIGLGEETDSDYRLILTSLDNKIL